MLPLSNSLIEVSVSPNYSSKDSTYPCPLKIKLLSSTRVSEDTLINWTQPKLKSSKKSEGIKGGAGILLDEIQIITQSNLNQCLMGGNLALLIGLLCWSSLLALFVGLGTSTRWMTNFRLPKVVRGGRTIASGSVGCDDRRSLVPGDNPSMSESKKTMSGSPSGRGFAAATATAEMDKNIVKVRRKDIVSVRNGRWNVK